MLKSIRITVETIKSIVMSVKMANTEILFISHETTWSVFQNPVT